MNSWESGIRALEERIRRRQSLERQRNALLLSMVILGAALMLGSLAIATKQRWKGDDPGAFLRGLSVYGVALGLPIGIYWIGLGLLGRCEHRDFAGNCRKCDEAIASEKAKLRELLEAKEQEWCKLVEPLIADVLRIRQERRRDEAARLSQLRHLQDMEPLQFERIVHEMFSRLGWSVTATKSTGDDGIDGLLRRADELWVLQCKRYRDSNKVGSPVLRDLLGATVGASAGLGVLVTTSSFTGDARKWANGKPLKLIDGGELVVMMRSTFPAESEIPSHLLKESCVEVRLNCPICKSEIRLNALKDSHLSCRTCVSAYTKEVLGRPARFHLILNEHEARPATRGRNPFG